MTDVRKGSYIKGRFLCRRKLGEGAFAEVWEVEDAEHPPAKYAVKLEKHRDAGNLRKEHHVLQRFAGCSQVVHSHGTDVHGDLMFIVLDLLGCNLHELRRSHGNTVPLPLVKHVAASTLTAIRQVHETGFIHRDIKPANFAARTAGVAPGDDAAEAEWVLLDFGLARRISDEHGELLPARPREPGATFRGSTSYASVGALRCEDQGRRDDVWSWLYMVVELVYGGLPWRLDRAAAAALGDNEVEKAADKARVAGLKEAAMEDPQLLAGGAGGPLPEPLVQISNYLCSLDFGDAPDYDSLLQLTQLLPDELPGVAGAAVGAAGAGGGGGGGSGVVDGVGPPAAEGSHGATWPAVAGVGDAAAAAMAAAAGGQPGGLPPAAVGGGGAGLNVLGYVDFSGQQHLQLMQGGSGWQPAGDPAGVTAGGALGSVEVNAAGNGYVDQTAGPYHHHGAAPPGGVPPAEQYGAAAAAAAAGEGGSDRTAAAEGAGVGAGGKRLRPAAQDTAATAAAGGGGYGGGTDDYSSAKRRREEEPAGRFKGGRPLSDPMRSPSSPASQQQQQADGKERALQGGAAADGERRPDSRAAGTAAAGAAAGGGGGGGGSSERRSDFDADDDGRRRGDREWDRERSERDGSSYHYEQDSRQRQRSREVYSSSQYERDREDSGRYRDRERERDRDRGSRGEADYYSSRGGGGGSRDERGRQRERSPLPRRRGSSRSPDRDYRSSRQGDYYQTRSPDGRYRARSRSRSRSRGRAASKGGGVGRLAGAAAEGEQRGDRAAAAGGGGGAGAGDKAGKGEAAARPPSQNGGEGGVRRPGSAGLPPSGQPGRKPQQQQQPLPQLLKSPRARTPVPGSAGLEATMGGVTLKGSVHAVNDLILHMLQPETPQLAERAAAVSAVAESARSQLSPVETAALVAVLLRQLQSGTAAGDAVAATQLLLDVGAWARDAAVKLAQGVDGTLSLVSPGKSPAGVGSEVPQLQLPAAGTPPPRHQQQQQPAVGVGALMPSLQGAGGVLQAGGMSTTGQQQQQQQQQASQQYL